MVVVMAGWPASTGRGGLAGGEGDAVPGGGAGVVKLRVSSGLAPASLEAVTLHLRHTQAEGGRLGGGERRCELGGVVGAQTAGGREGSQGSMLARAQSGPHNNGCLACYHSSIPCPGAHQTTVLGVRPEMEMTTLSARKSKWYWLLDTTLVHMTL